MATFTAQSNNNSNYTLRLAVTENSTNVASNTSAVSWELWLDSTYARFEDYTMTAVVVLDGVTVYSNTSGRSMPARYESLLLGSGTAAIAHNTDGSKSVACAASISMQAVSYTPGDVSAGGTMTLTTIPRATTPTIGAVTLGSPATIGCPRASDGFTHTLTYAFGSASDTIATGVGASYAWTPPLSLAAQIPSAVSGIGTVTCITYNGSTVVGAETISFTASVPASVVPTVSALMYPSSTNTWVRAKGIYAAGFSRVRIDTTGAGACGSTVSRIDITGDVLSYNAAASATSDVLTAGTKTVTVTVTDSRGRSASATKSITVQPYSPPAISSLTYRRGTYAGGVFTAGDSGEDVEITFNVGLSLTAYGNAASASVAVDGETTQTITGEGRKTLHFTGIGASVSRALSVTVTDSTGTNSIRNDVISTTAVTVNCKEGGRGVGIGKYAEIDNAVEIRSDWKLYCRGRELVDLIYPVGSIYLSAAAASPATWLGGVWEQIKGRFLLAADGTYGAGTTGGEAAHALSIDEMPKHNHGYEVRSPLNNQSGAVQHGFADYNNSNWWAGTWSYVTAAGGGQPHNNMPPYLAVYMWKRTA